MEYFDRARFARALERSDWYVLLREDLRRLFQRITEDRAHAAAVKEALYGFFEAELAADRVALAVSGPNRDAERLPIDRAVLHHTGNPVGISAARLSAMQLLRLYAAYAAASPADFGKPIWSNHLRGGTHRPVFYAYHWLVRRTGVGERLLEDHEIGWHAGDWGWNCRSIGIALDGNHERGVPPSAQLQGVANLLRAYYPQIGPEAIFGHCEVPRSGAEPTLCPGNLFVRGWKRTIQRLVSER